MILTIALAICGGVGFCIACAAGGCCESVDVDGKPGGDDVEARTRNGADDLPPPPKRWSPEERQALCHAFLRLPPPCLPEARAIVGDEPTVDFASLDVSVCDRLQQYVDAQPLRDSLAAKADQICGLSGIAFVCVVPAFCGFWYFGIRCAFSTP